MLKATNFSLEVTDEKTGDSKLFENPVEDLHLENCLADRAYDTEDIFELSEEERLGPQGVKIRKNATPSLSPGGKAVREFQEQGYEEWKKTTTMARGGLLKASSPPSSDASARQ